MNRPQRALYGPSVSSRFQTRLAEELAAILSRNAPKVKEYFIGRLSCSNFYSSIHFTPVTYRLYLIVVLSKSSRSFVPTLVRLEFNNIRKISGLTLYKSFL